MIRENACKNLDASISEIQYSITAKHSKSEIEHEHYLRNAIRFIEEAKELMKEVAE